jgi:hypothetical protein
MDALILEPYAEVQRWSIPGTQVPWTEVFSDYLEELAHACQASGPAVIGHIKALALFPDSSYLRISVVAPHIPAQVDGEAPPGWNTLDLTVNVIVYSLARSTLEEITWQVAQRIAQQWKGEVCSLPT